MSFRSFFYRSQPHRKVRRADHGYATRRLRFETFEDRRMLSFTPASSFTVGDEPLAVVAADFNNDERLDLATADSGDNAVSVLLGNGDGTFQSPVTSAAADAPRSLAVGDFDADGNLDLAVVNAYSLSYYYYGNSDPDPSNGVSVMFGNGDGSFQAPSNVPLDRGAKATSLAVGDFNNDGTMDLAVASNVDWYYPGDVYPDSGQVTVLLANADRSFSTAGTFWHSYPINSAVVADFDSDGHEDLVVGTYYSDGSWPPKEAVRVLKGDGTGNIAEFRLVNWVIDHGTSMAAGDINGDLKLDLVTADGNDVNVRLGDGVGGFQAPPGGQSYFAGTRPTSLVLGDFNGDGVLDIATANALSNDVSVLRGRGDGAFMPPEHFAAGLTALSGDFDLDGDVDGRDFLVWQRNPTVGDLADWRTNYGNSASHDPDPSPVSVAVGDFNGDGWLDLATANALGNSVSILLNDQTSAPLPTAASISIDDVTKQEGNGKKKTLFVFTVTLSAAADQDVTMSYRTVFATANNWIVWPTTRDNDYVDKTGTLTFAPGETTKTITIEVNADNKVETDEVFYVDLFDSSINSVFTKSIGIGTILNDD